jgi:hypothetical protein
LPQLPRLPKLPRFESASDCEVFKALSGFQSLAIGQFQISAISVISGKFWF